MTDPHGAGAAKLAETYLTMLVRAGSTGSRSRCDSTPSTRQLAKAREQVGHCEIGSNRLHRPRVHLGSGTSWGRDQTVSVHLVVMRRIPEDRLSTLVRARTVVEGALQQVARSIAALHGGVATSDAITASGRRYPRGPRACHRPRHSVGCLDARGAAGDRPDTAQPG